MLGGKPLTHVRPKVVIDVRGVGCGWVGEVGGEEGGGGSRVVAYRVVQGWWSGGGESARGCELSEVCSNPLR
jgi:hypothetical protein